MTIENYLNEFPETQIICLKENMRSTQSILDFAELIAKEDPNRLKSQLGIDGKLTAKNEKIIYGVLEIEDQNNNNNGYIVSYYDDGTIKHLNKETSFGQGPCHISVCKGKRMIFVSNYNNGYFTICRIINRYSNSNTFYHIMKYNC